MVYHIGTGVFLRPPLRIGQINFDDVSLAVVIELRAHQKPRRAVAGKPLRIRNRVACYQMCRIRKWSPIVIGMIHHGKKSKFIVATETWMGHLIYFEMYGPI